MKALIAASALAALFALPVYAQTEAETPMTAEEAEEAAAVISGVAADQAKVDGYCAITKEMAAAPEGDEAKADELSDKWDTYVATLGDDAAGAFEAADSVDPASPEGQILENAFEELDAKCGA